jgi:hypothetical protein
MEQQCSHPLVPPDSGDDWAWLLSILQVRKKLEEVKQKKQEKNDDDYLPDGIDRCRQTDRQTDRQTAHEIAANSDLPHVGSRGQGGLYLGYGNQALW